MPNARVEEFSILQKSIGTSRNVVVTAVRLSTRHGQVVNIPYTQECNDVAVIAVQHHRALEYRDRAIDQFEQLYLDAKDSARVMALVFHPYLMGVPHQVPLFSRGPKHICRRPDVLFWTGEEIHDWYLAQSADPRMERSTAQNIG